MNKSHKQGGFTLVELLVVISIIVILMTIILGVYFSAKKRSDEKKVRAEMKAIEVAIDSFHADNDYYPPGDYDHDNPGNFDPKMNGLFGSLTQGFGKGKDGKPLKNFLEGTQMKSDSNGNLVAPVNDPDNPSQPNYWQYNAHSPTNNPVRFDLWVFLRIDTEAKGVTYKDENNADRTRIEEKEKARVYLGNWPGDYKYEKY